MGVRCYKLEHTQRELPPHTTHLYVYRGFNPRSSYVLNANIDGGPKRMGKSFRALTTRREMRSSKCVDSFRFTTYFRAESFPRSDSTKECSLGTLLIENQIVEY